MNAIQPFAAAKLAAIPDTFEAWRVRDGGVAVPLDITAGTMAEAVQSACASCSHKDTLLIRHTFGRTGKAVLIAFRIRQETKRQWRRDPLTGAEGWQHKLYPEELFSIGVKAFSPVEPFVWTPGCDVVGAEKGVIRG